MNPIEMVMATFREFGIVQERVDAIFKQKLPVDLPTVQFKLLNHLISTSNKDEMVSDIAKNSHVTLSAMSQVIKQARKNGFVELISQEQDARKKSVVITDQGRSTYQCALESFDIDLKGLADNFSVEELQQLYELSNRFRIIFEKQNPTRSDI
jgi:DNA-binding MarR family transcriptional regulator